MSYCPSGNELTNFYWDDWALSGLLKRGGSTLTLGLAGGTGPARLAAVDPSHRQTAVDLDLSHFKRGRFPIKVARADAFEYLDESRGLFDTIWVDLYAPQGIAPVVMSPLFLERLRWRLNPKGLIFFHFFRPQNRFYRYFRDGDLFEPWFARLAASRGFRSFVFDHYASQTWLLAPRDAADPRDLLRQQSERLPQEERRWLADYMLRIVRRVEPPRTGPIRDEDYKDFLLLKAFRAPVSAGALHVCGFSWRTGSSADLDALSETPHKLITDDLKATSANRLRWETMAMWLTGVGLRLPPRCRKHLIRVAERYQDSGALEFERRRHLLSTSRRPHAVQAR